MNRLVFWGVVLLITGSFVYLVSDTLVPFMISFVFAYLLQPAIETNCKRFKLPRSIATLGIFTMFLSGFAAIMVLIVPIIYQQIAIFVSKIPQYKSNFESGIAAWSEKLNEVNPELAYKVTESANSFIDSAFSIFASFANHIWQYTLAKLIFLR